MNKEFKEKWLAALRSGEYKQTKGKLKDKEGYCCLGVLCDTIDNTKWGDYSDLNKGYRYGNELVTFLPNSINCKVHIPSDIETRLMEMNDKDGLSFNQIADYIEENL